MMLAVSLVLFLAMVVAWMSLPATRAGVDR